MKTISVTTKKKREIIDITPLIEKEIEGKSGIVHLFIKHTTAGIMTADLDPGTDSDYLKALDKIAPKLAYYHAHDPSHFPDHLMATLIGASLSLPVKNGDIQTGAWQKIALVEFDGPRERGIVISISS